MGKAGSPKASCRRLESDSVTASTDSAHQEDEHLKQASKRILITIATSISLYQRSP